MVSKAPAALLFLLAATPATARETIGVYGAWGAFADAAPAHCFALAEPVPPRAASKPFVSIATWPGRGARNQFYVRLSRPRAPGAAATLSIGERRFALSGGTGQLWAPDARTDTAIVAAMRAGRSMSVESTGASGAPFADVYALHGAATAIDAATVACLPH